MYVHLNYKSVIVLYQNILNVAVVDAQLAARQRELGRLEAEVDAQDLLLTDRKMELSTVTTELATARRLLTEISKCLVFFLKNC